MNKKFQRRINRLLARMEIDLHREREKSAIGWGVAVFDTEEFPGTEKIEPTLVHVVGLYPTSEAAFIAAGKMATGDCPTEEGWRYSVVPIFKTDEEENENV